MDDYTKKVHKLLMGMKPGDVLQIEKITKSETRDKFIQAVKDFMAEHHENYQDGLSFGKGFSELRKQDLDFIMQNTKTKNVTL